MNVTSDSSTTTKLKVS